MLLHFNAELKIATLAPRTYYELYIKVGSNLAIHRIRNRHLISAVLSAAMFTVDARNTRCLINCIFLKTSS
jgi:hypothetical protein